MPILADDQPPDALAAPPPHLHVLGGPLGMSIPSLSSPLDGEAAIRLARRFGSTLRSSDDGLEVAAVSEVREREGVDR